MNHFPFYAISHCMQFDKRHVLGLSWIVGLFAGGSCFLSGADRLIPLMRVSVNGNVSIVCFFCLIFLPPFLSILAASTGMHSLLYVIAFGKAFLYAFASMALLLSFGSAGWLVRLLLGFSGILSAPVLYRFWLRCLYPGSGLSALEVFCFISVYLLIGSIDYRVIMPFGAGLYF